MVENNSNFGANACIIFSFNKFAFALSSASGKTIDTLQKLDTETGAIEETKLRTLAKNSASKLPELRNNFAWFTTATFEESEDGDQSGGDGEPTREVKLNLFMHGGSVMNAKTKKKKFLNDFYHLDVAEGLFRKFFLFDAAKGREGHTMARIENEVYLYGGKG